MANPVGKILFLCCLFILLPVAIAGLIKNDKELLHDSFQARNWADVIERSDRLIDSQISESQKDLYRLLQAMAFFQQARVDESIAALRPISEQSLYFAWAKLFLSRLAYVSDNFRLLEQSLHGLNKTSLKGEIKVEAQFYESQLLIKTEKWKEAEKLLKSIERKGRGSDVYSSILEALALVELQTRGSKNSCQTLKKLYMKYPKHLWFSASAPDIRDIALGGKKISCAVTEKEFNARRRNLNLLGDFVLVNAEIKKWIQTAKLSVKKQKILLAQQNVAEGHPEIALKILKEVPDYKSDIEILNPLSFAAARAGEMALAIDSALAIHSIAGFNRTGSMALYQAALWSYQMRDYENAELRFKKLKPNRLSRFYQTELQWYLGWLRYLRGDFIAAEKSFQALLKSRRGRSQTHSQERIQYWMAMAQFQSGKKEKARDILFRLSERKGMNYYSFLARERLKHIPITPAESLLKEEIPLVIVPAGGVYPSPFTEIAPQLSLKEMEDEEMSVSGDEVTDEATVVAEEELKVETSEDSIAETQESQAEAESHHLEVFTQSESMVKIERAKAFWSVGLDELARREVSDLEKNRTSVELLKKISEEYRAMGLFNRLSKLGHDFSSRADFNSNKFIYEAIYPRAYMEHVQTASSETNVAKSLIWGIMKAESMYRPWVKSPVGALGLMQVMPVTGQRLAEIIDYKNFSPQVLLKPKEAIQFGSKYLERLGKKFDHTVQLVAAAYNAGPHRVSQWLYYFGYMQMDEWVEHIPFIETRNYVKRVTVNYIAYNELYGKDQSDSLALIGPVPVQLAGAPETKESWE